VHWAFPGRKVPRGSFQNTIEVIRFALFGSVEIFALNLKIWWLKLASHHDAHKVTSAADPKKIVKKINIPAITS